MAGYGQEGGPQDPEEDRRTRRMGGLSRSGGRSIGEYIWELR